MAILCYRLIIQYYVTWITFVVQGRSGFGFVLVQLNLILVVYENVDLEFDEFALPPSC